MSMISSLIDELRKSADEWNSSNMFELAHMCSDAADTIWQLRDDLQQAHERLVDAEHDESRAWDRVRKAEAENAKLRELAREVYVLHWHGLDCTECPWFDECDTDGGCPWMSILADRMRELGVEVD